jgi:MarR family 2-MHQ and catechol resistance regulon transcriptional repressor
LLVISQGWGLIDLPLRASNEHFLIFYISLSGEWPRLPFTARIERPPLHRGGSASKKGTWPLPSHLLTIRSSADYPLGMELPDLKDDPYLKVLRPLVEAYLAFELTASRHIKSLRLTPSQFDVIATLGDTDGLTCSELSAHTLVTKGTLTGVLDRLVAKGLIRRDSVKDDRRCVKIRLTEKGDTMFRDTFAAHIAFIKPFFERALNQKDIDVARTLLLRLRDSFQQEG